MTHHVLLESVNFGAPTFVFRVRRRHAFGNETHFRVGLRDRGTRFHLAERQIIVGVPVAQFPRLKGQRQPDLRLSLREMGPRRHDSNHGLRLGIQRDDSADDVGVAAEMSLPEFVAQEHDVVFAESILLRQEVAAQDRLHSEESEDVGRHTPARDRLGRAQACEDGVQA